MTRPTLAPIRFLLAAALTAALLLTATLPAAGQSNLAGNGEVSITPLAAHTVTPDVDYLDELVFRYERVGFAFDSAGLNTVAEKILRRKADYLKAHPDATVMIEGHCDAVGPSEYNLLLGEKRAGSVKRFFLSSGVGADRLDTISYGEEKPLVNETSEAAFELNRRAEFVKK